MKPCYNGGRLLSEVRGFEVEAEWGGEQSMNGRGKLVRAALLMRERPRGLGEYRMVVWRRK